MRHKLILLSLTLFLSVSWAAAAVQDCPALVKNALERTENACALMRGNQACYGYRTLQAELQPGLSKFAFNGVGDITPVDTIQSLRLSPLDPVTNEWGISVMRVHADIPDSKPNQNVTLVAFGDVSIDPAQGTDFQPMQAFALRTGDASSGCTDVTENGLLVQTPEGVGRVTLWINEVRVRVGSTVLFQAKPGGDMTISTFEGHAEVEAAGETQEATTGMQVHVPLNDDMQPSAPPTEPEEFDAETTGLTSLIDLVTAFTDGTVGQLTESGGGDGSGGASGHTGDCNGEHGQGAANGNCYGHNNPPGNSQGNGGSGGGHGNGG